MNGRRNRLVRLCRHSASTILFGAAALALAACGTAGPPPVTYVLGEPAIAEHGAEPLAGRPVVEVKPVLVPDYLDVSDILIRGAEHVVVPSLTGRWGERLSVGVTRALTAGLTRRLPGLIVTASAPIERPARQVLVEVQTFEPRIGGAVVLVARWRVLDGAGREMLDGERVSLTQPVAGPGDAALVAAMSAAVEALADRVAAGIESTNPESDSKR